MAPKITNKGLVQYINQQFSTLRLQMGQMLGVSHDNQRDIYSIYGYPRKISFNDMWLYSRRHGIANRITHGVAKSCWRDGFELFEDSEDDSGQVLEDELNKLKKSGLNKAIEQADILNRIGKFSVLFIGVPDGKDPKEPLGKVSGGKLDQVYFKAFAYDGIQITQQVTDAKDPRFGLPEMYQVQKISRGDLEKDTQQSSMQVHWTRIVHINEEALDSDIEGMGQLEPIFNRILDLDKTTGGAAEAYFRNARGKIAYEIDKDFAPTLLKDQGAKDAFDKGAKEFTNQWKDFVVASGAKVSSIDTPQYTPKDTVLAALWEISGYSGIAIRILTGEGAGQLAGSEDQLSYNALISGRQFVFCGPVIVFGALQILQNAGMIDLPEDYDIRFPVQQAVTEAQESEINNKKADTISKIVSSASLPGGDEIDVEKTLAGLGIDVEIEPLPDGSDDMDDMESKEDGGQPTEDINR